MGPPIGCPTLGLHAHKGLSVVWPVHPFSHAYLKEIWRKKNFFELGNVKANFDQIFFSCCLPELLMFFLRHACTSCFFLALNTGNLSMQAEFCGKSSTRYPSRSRRAFSFVFTVTRTERRESSLELLWGQIVNTRVARPFQYAFHNITFELMMDVH